VKGKDILLILAMTMLFAGCQAMEQYSPEQVMTNAIDSDVEDDPYYGEMTMTFEDAEETITMEVKEWRKDDKSLEEVMTDGEKMITLKDGEKVTIYDEAENMVYETEFEEPSDLTFSSRERVEDILDLIGETHTIEKEDDEKIAGRDTIHLVAKKKSGEKSLFDTQEMWIDKENWHLLKMVDHTADNLSTIEYTNIDLDPNFDDDVFVLDIPDDATFETFDEDIEETITLNEAIDIMDSSFLYVKDNDNFSLEEITTMDFGEEMEKTISMTYVADGLPYMEITVTPTDDNTEEELFADEFEETVSLRGTKGQYLNLDGESHWLTWQEGDFSYDILFIHPDTTLEEMLEIVEDMEEVSI